MDIKISSYDELPEWVDKNNDVSNNGSGKEYAGYLIIEDGDYKAVYNDAMEPEDARLYRDLNWVSKEIKRAYESGFKKGEEKAEFKFFDDTEKSAAAVILGESYEK